MKTINCPICGATLRSKTLKKGKNYQRSVKSFICEPCGYAEYDESESEHHVLNGDLDSEIGILKAE